MAGSAHRRGNVWDGIPHTYGARSCAACLAVSNHAVRVAAGLHGASEHHRTVVRDGRGWACVECDGVRDLVAMLWGG